MTEDYDARVIAEEYVAAKRRIDEGRGTWIDYDNVAWMEQYMNGPHPLLDALSSRAKEGNDA